MAKIQRGTTVPDLLDTGTGTAKPVQSDSLAPATSKAERAGWPRSFAEKTSCQAFIMGYLREVDPGCPWTQRQWRQRYPDATLELTGQHLLELRLPAQDTALLLDLHYKSKVGCHQIQAIYGRRGNGWVRESYWSALLTLVKEIYLGKRVQVDGPVKTRQLELTYRLTDSLQNMIRYLERYPDGIADVDNFLAAEQCLVLGHWMHPTPKSRQGMVDWQHPLFAPEFRGEFALHYFAVDRTLVYAGAAGSGAAGLNPRGEGAAGSGAAGDPDPETIVFDAAGWPLETLQENEVLLPCHPLQAQWLLARSELQCYFANGRIRSLGAMGRTFSATSSVRTVYSDDFPWMFKFSIPVKITNSLRQNKRHELTAGLVMTRLCQDLDFFARFSRFSLIADPACMALQLPGQKESGFECIIRRNPFQGAAAAGKLTLAALLQDNWPGAGAAGNSAAPQSLLQHKLEGLAAREGRGALEVAKDWFDGYWDCALVPLIHLLDKWGIALEAHQQNSVLDLGDGYPRHYFYRDNQGFYLARTRQDTLLQRLPELAESPELFYDTDMMLDRFGYYLLINQLFAVIYRLGRDGYANEDFWLARCQAKLQVLQGELHDLGAEFIRRVLERPTLPTKANLLTRVNDIDELEAELEMAIYVGLPNPLQLARKLQPATAVVEYA